MSAAITIYVPLDWLFFVRSEDYSLTPEALASELDLNVLYSTLERMVYARVTATSLVPTTATLWTTQPAITQSALYTQLIHTTQVEKALHLATYESAQGNVYKILGELPGQRERRQSDGYGLRVCSTRLTLTRHRAASQPVHCGRRGRLHDQAGQLPSGLAVLDVLRA